MHAVDMPAVHPAADAAVNLIPGLRSWADTAVKTVSQLDYSKIPLDRASLFHWYANTDPLHSALTFASVTTLITFILGEATTNWSSVDRIWAVLPVLYSAHFTFHDRWSGAGSVKGLFDWSSNASANTDPSASWFSALVPNGVNDRMFLVFLLQVLWSIRITGNTLRRGFFDFKSEDYRWPVIRKWMPKWVWPIFDFTIVALMQNFLLLAAALPQYLLLTTTRAYHPTHPVVPLGKADLAIAALFLLNLATEQIADSQQQAFQNWKHGTALKEGKGSRMLKGYSPKQLDRAEGDLKRGFTTSGLWAWSRHPNFICEQLNFWILPLFTLRATVPEAVFTKVFSAARATIDLHDSIYIRDALKQAAKYIFNYSWISSIWMSSILIGSTVLLTEPISSSKYPKYRQYQRRVGMFFPSTTILKGIWLALTGNLATVNEQVYGSGKQKDQ
ncbi:hypothetical protein P389DRAFT_192582 [Cystobasidium minutum MCA 4210]|uniref:uncharacterized protein n=1 Tax=Cystobasidium minutum MCA 4210 TaxID=1397322 RepID=UPI0034CEA73E|eukprot:jgi/Rhomi1/192582/gm1.796_g